MTGQHVNHNLWLLPRAGTVPSEGGSKRPVGILQFSQHGVAWGSAWPRYKLRSGCEGVCAVLELCDCSNTGLACLTDETEGPCTLCLAQACP